MPVRGTSKGDTVIAIILVFLVLFTAPRLLWLPSIFTFITACQFVFIAKWNDFYLEDFITHPLKEKLDLLLKPQLRQVVQQLKIQHEGNVKKAELKCLILDYLVKEDLISNNKFDSASSKVEIR